MQNKITWNIHIPEHTVTTHKAKSQAIYAHIYFASNMMRETKGKKMMVQWARLPRLFGLRIQQPVIPPLSREGSVHCSVKPASCGSLRSSDQEI